MSKENGGPAFARSFSKNGEYSDSPKYHAQDGMTLRDYFAAKAMQAMVSNECAVQRYATQSGINMVSPDVLMATGAYLIADRMLEARKK